MRPTGSRTAQVLAAAVTACALSSVALLDTAASAATPTTTSVIAATKSALAKQSAAHLVNTSKAGTSKESVVADLGKVVGQETITDGASTAGIKITPTYAYLDGSSSGLTNLFGLTAAQAKEVGTKWMSVKAGTTQYTDLKSGTTVSAIAATLPAAKGTTLSKTTLNNQTLFVLKWTTAATSSEPKLTNTMTISQASLPVQETTTASSGSETTTFSKWGEHVVVSTPATANTISYTKVSS